MLLGENGAGKTSLLKSMLRYYPLSGGQVLYCGIDCAALRDKEHAAIFSYAAQMKELVEDMLVEDCIVAGRTRCLSVLAMPKKQDYEAVDSWLKKLNIEHLKGKYLHEISGGELQLVYLAKALIQDAQVMLMDEPCTYSVSYTHLDVYKRQYYRSLYCRFDYFQYK